MKSYTVANIAFRSITAKKKVKKMAKTYILLLQEVTQGQLLALGKGLREVSRQLAF